GLKKPAKAGSQRERMVAGPHQLKLVANTDGAKLVLPIRPFSLTCSQMVSLPGLRGVLVFSLAWLKLKIAPVRSAASPDYSSAQLLLDKALHANPKRQRGKCVAPPRLRFGLVWADE
ncbi:MAG TPA: hypothetical protein VMV10_13740, partial [Pirellulales bacterium]|nr:hypothetical protein [Pirellulales bacterium]